MNSAITQIRSSRLGDRQQPKSAQVPGATDMDMDINHDLLGTPEPLLRKLVARSVSLTLRHSVARQRDEQFKYVLCPIDSRVKHAHSAGGLDWLGGL